MPRKYALDTNVFIDAFRSETHAEALVAFHERFAPFEYLSVLVALELRAGARTAEAAARLQKHVFDVYERRGRVFMPGRGAWLAAANALASLRGVESGSRSFYNDVLLAASCREHGVTLVTNRGDFERIGGVLPFDFILAGDA